jgi:hypothetical protein
MKKYIIKVTYLEGAHEGKSYFLNKDGYVVDNLDYVWQDCSYTLSACKAVCTRKEKTNTAEAIFEKRERERRISEGKTVSKYPLYTMCSYEPYEIETVDK